METAAAPAAASFLVVIWSFFFGKWWCVFFRGSNFRSGGAGGWFRLNPRERDRERERREREREGEKTNLIKFWNRFCYFSFPQIMLIAQEKKAAHFFSFSFFCCFVFAWFRTIFCAHKFLVAVVFNVTRGAETLEVTKKKPHHFSGDEISTHFGGRFSRKCREGLLLFLMQMKTPSVENCSLHPKFKVFSFFPSFASLSSLAVTPTLRIQTLDWLTWNERERERLDVGEEENGD